MSQRILERAKGHATEIAQVIKERPQLLDEKGMGLSPDEVEAYGEIADAIAQADLPDLFWLANKERLEGIRNSPSWYNITPQTDQDIRDLAPWVLERPIGVSNEWDEYAASVGDRIRNAFVDLQGSDAQVAWANNIREAMVVMMPAFAACQANPKFGERDMELVEKVAEVAVWIAGHGEAKWWIDNLGKWEWTLAPTSQAPTKVLYQFSRAA